MNAIDTNVLIYAQDPRDPDKRQAASELIRNLDDGVLLWQVACEYVAAARKLAPYGLSIADAWRDVASLRQVWTCLLPDWEFMRVPSASYRDTVALLGTRSSSLRAPNSASDGSIAKTLATPAPSTASR